jgi:cell division protein FtsN
MLLGLVLGLVIGLAIAVAVALYISNAPLPFVTKVRPPSANTAVPADGKLPDPNRSLNLAPPPPPAATAPAPPPAAPAAPPAGKGEATPATPEAAAAAAARQEALPDGSRFLLQAGAFKSAEDADGMRAQLAMLGLDARIFPIEHSGQTLYRVRLGPFGQLDDVNRVRKLLADNSIEAQVIRLR